MSTLPAKEQQIVQMHATFIHQVVQACQNQEQRKALEPILQTGSQNGWGELVAALRLVLDGHRELTRLQALDEDDRVIVEAILRGLHDPSSLPSVNTKADPKMAAPGLADMIKAAGSGNPQALQLISNMATDMQKAGGDMAFLAAAIRPMINGERDPEVLCKKMSPQGEALVISILEALGEHGRIH